jgi:hypothetical protein
MDAVLIVRGEEAAEFSDGELSEKRTRKEGREGREGGRERERGGGRGVGSERKREVVVGGG